MRQGEKIIPTGALIRPYEVALLAAQGIGQVKVIQKPQAAIVATGDELTQYRDEAGPGKIRNANGPAMAAALMRWGAVPTDRGIARDNPACLKDALAEAFETSDLTVISGGVSVGDFDYTKDTLEDLGLKVIFWKVAIKPGKPMLFGLWKSKPVFGLPGNPISALVCLEEFVRPAIEKMRGHANHHPSYHLKGIVKNSYSKEAARQQFLFCVVEETPLGFDLHIIRPQGSAMLAMAAKATALAVAPIGMSRIDPGTELVFRWLK